MAPLGDAEKAAVVGFLRSKRGTRSLQSHVHEKLTDFFAAKGITLLELNKPPPTSPADKEMLEEEWSDYAVDAGLTDQSDRKNAARWIVSEESTGTGAGARSGRAHAVADALARRGTAIDSAGELTIAAALLEADRGELAVQCRAVEVVWLIYTGELPGEEERTWFREKRQSALLGGTGEDPKIDIRRYKPYVKTLAGSSALTLERALREKSGLMWTRYFQDTTERLQQTGFVAAAARWQKIVFFARDHNLNDSARERQYLQHYFFVEQLGRGLPTEVCYKSALMMNASPATLAAQQAFDLRPTVAADPFADMLSGLSMGGSMAAGGLMAAGGSYGMQQGSMPGNGGMSPLYLAGVQPHGPPTAPLPGFAQSVLPPATQPPPDAANPMSVTPCAFCGGQRHAMEKCTFYLSARKQHQQKQATERATADATRAAAAAAAAANAGAGAGASTQP